MNFTRFIIISLVRVIIATLTKDVLKICLYSYKIITMVTILYTISIQYILVILVIKLNKNFRDILPTVSKTEVTNTKSVNQ